MSARRRFSHHNLIIPSHLTHRNVTACIEQCQAESPYLAPGGGSNNGTNASAAAASIFGGRTGRSSPTGEAATIKDAETRRALRIVISLGACLFAVCCGVIAWHHNRDGPPSSCLSSCCTCCW